MERALAFGNVSIGWVFVPAISIRESVSMPLDVLKDKTKYLQYTCCNMFLALFRKLGDCLSVQIDHFDRSLPAPSRAFDSHEFLLIQLAMAPGILPSLCVTRYRICLLTKRSTRPYQQMQVANLATCTSQFMFNDGNSNSSLFSNQERLVVLTILKNMKVNGKDDPIYYGK